jgi:CBS domain-containing protein
MLSQDVMKKNVECLAPRESVESAARMMRDSNIGFLPICENGGKVLGTLTDRDIAVRMVAEGMPGSTPVEKVMSREVISCKPSDDLKKVQKLMAQHHKSRILCIENGRLVGVISLSDIADRDGAGAAQTMKEVSQREVQS